MKKILGILLVVLFFSACKTEKKETITIGAILPLTGGYAQYGNYMRQGMELALEDAINSGKIISNEIQLIFEDSQADPKKSVSAINKLIEINLVTACIPATSGVTLAIKPIANKNEVILVNATAISPQIEDSSDYVYSIIPDAAFEGKFLAEIGYSKLGKKNAAIIYRNDQSGKSFFTNISKRFKNLGGKVVYEDAHQPNTNDFRTYITKIATFDSIDIIYVMSFGPEVANFAKQAKELGINKQIVTYETFNSPTSLEIAGNAANGIIFCSPQFNKDSDNKSINELKAKVLEKYNHNEMNFFIAAHYDAIMLLINAISRGNKTGKEIKEYFDEMNTFNGITGPIKFNNKGGAIVPLQLYKVENNEFITIK